MTEKIKTPLAVTNEGKTETFNQQDYTTRTSGEASQKIGKQEKRILLLPNMEICSIVWNICPKLD